MSRYDDIIDLSKVEPPKLIEEREHTQIFAEIKGQYQLKWPEWQDETEFEPVRAHLHVDAQLAYQANARINTAARAALLASATGSDLDAKGDGRTTPRKVVQAGEDDAPDVLEGDEDYRERIRLAPESWSTAGPEGAYEFWAKSVPGVRDARAYSPAPCVVEIYIAPDDLSAPASAALLAAVNEAVSGKARRPIGDRVSVKAAEILNTPVTATLYVLAGPSVELLKEKAAMLATAYLLSRQKIWKSLYLSKLNGTLAVDGAEYASTNLAGDVLAAKHQIIWASSLNVSVEVLDA
ncbi:baseplate J/gp47 family protein [Pseudovibrio sp. Tun.PSC04-5.I4]|uniref:baseplate assembly protein n=1 Tax=Pseudovibrio sp. Tun.PSC04-5.I4 TaxID=1798213 RepID=UPI00088330F8|nr:baseplate J/gp47 family protein [Pseudovibrio sp. Tun.PSC04-5.I4]SDR07543.1 Phage-related baseplate assembly protein [Pseudovibrio sp. Tun.PSC04-5.I4]